MHPLWTVRALWQNATGRGGGDSDAMGEVRPALLAVVYSRLSDEEAAARIGDLVREHPRAAGATLRYVRQTVGFAHEYDTDRAHRVLDAAIQGTHPAPIRAQDAELFARERALGWLPLSEAFAQLCALVPQLTAVGTRVQEAAASPQEHGIVQDPASDSIEIPDGVLLAHDRLVGPRARHADPLVRSFLAAKVVARYEHAVLTGATGRAVWEPTNADSDAQTDAARATGGTAADRSGP